MEVSPRNTCSLFPRVRPFLDFCPLVSQGDLYRSTDYAITFGWQPAMSMGTPLLSYRVESAESPDGPWSAFAPIQAQETDIRVTDEDLEPRTIYYYRVTATNAEVLITTVTRTTLPQ